MEEPKPPTQASIINDLANGVRKSADTVKHQATGIEKTKKDPVSVAFHYQRGRDVLAQLHEQWQQLGDVLDLADQSRTELYQSTTSLHNGTGEDA